MDDDGPHLYKLYQGIVVHEDTRNQRRVSWLLGFSGLMFVAFVIVLNLSTQISIAQTLMRGYLLLLISGVGFLITLLVIMGMIGSGMAVRKAVRQWETLPLSEEKRRQFPTLDTVGWPRRFDRLASLGVCIVLLITWMVVLFLIPALG